MSSNDTEPFHCLVEGEEMLMALTDGPLHKRELAKETDKSKQTVYRNIQNPKEYGWVEQTGDGYRLTPLGHLHIELCERAIELSNTLSAASSLLSYLTKDHLPPVEFFVDAQYVTANRYAPDRPYETMEQLMQKTTQLSCILPVIQKRHVLALQDRISLERCSTELIFETPALNYFRSNFSEEFAQMIAADRATVSSIDEQIPFGLLIGSEPREIGLVIYDDCGKLRGIITSNAPAASRWIQQRCRTYRKHAKRTES